MNNNELNKKEYTLVLDSPKMFALQIAVADQLAIMQEALEADLDEETTLQATRLHAIYLNLLGDLDVEKSNLVGRWNEENGVVNNVVSINDFRKDDLNDDFGKK